MTDPRVKLRPLRVTQPGLHPAPAVHVSAQVCWAADLKPGEVVEVYDETTGAAFRLPVVIGASREVRVTGCAEIGVGHSLALSASRRPASRPGCTVCLCERNQVIEIRDASAPPLPGSEFRDLAFADCGAVAAGSHLSLVNLNPGPPRETCPDPGGGRQAAQ